MRRLSYLLTLILFISFVSCSKLDSKQHFTIDDNFMAYFNFNKGSQWKYYQLSDTNVVETATVSELYKGKMVWDAFDQQFVEYDLTSDMDSAYKVRAIADENKVTKASLFVLDTGYRVQTQWFYSSGTFSAVAGTGDSLYFHPSYSLGNKTFNEVIELKPAKSQIFIRLFMAKNVGIIRKEYKNGKTFILKSYQVF